MEHLGLGLITKFSLCTFAICSANGALSILVRHTGSSCLPLRPSELLHDHRVLGYRFKHTSVSAVSMQVCSKSFHSATDQPAFIVDAFKNS
jgi:hypothetical protein